MEKDKFILARKPRTYTQDRKHPLTRVSEEAYQELIKVAGETGLSVSYITSKAVLFALERLQYIDLE